MQKSKQMYAGILPYYVDANGVVWILLGQERQSLARDSLKWGAFGGAVENGESLIAAAAREGYEESMGLLGNEQQLLCVLSEQKSFLERSGRAKHYLLKLIVKDPLLPLYFEQFYAYAHRCARDAQQELPGLRQGSWEKCQVAWISLSEARRRRQTMRPAFWRDICHIPDALFV